MSAPDKLDSDCAGAATLIIIEQIKPGKEEAYQEWARRIQKIEAGFPGYQGGYTQPPTAGDTGWMTLLRFATAADLGRWLNSPERTALVAESEQYVDKSTLRKVESSFPGWIPTDPSTGKNPPNWKATMLVLLGLYPIVCLEIHFLMPHLSGMRPALAGFIGNAISVALVAYVTMPVLVRALDRWLFPKEQNGAKVNMAGTALILILFAIEVALFWNLL